VCLVNLSFRIFLKEVITILLTNKNLNKLINNKLRFYKVELKGCKSNYFGTDLKIFKPEMKPLVSFHNNINI